MKLKMIHVTRQCSVSTDYLLDIKFCLKIKRKCFEELSLVVSQSKKFQTSLPFCLKSIVFFARFKLFACLVG